MQQIISAKPKPTPERRIGSTKQTMLIEAEEVTNSIPQKGMSLRKQAHSVQPQRLMA